MDYNYLKNKLVGFLKKYVNEGNKTIKSSLMAYFTGINIYRLRPAIEYLKYIGILDEIKPGYFEINVEKLLNNDDELIRSKDNKE